MSARLLAASLAHLRALVGFDTRNPPRRIDAGGIFAYLREHLPGFRCQLVDHGAGAISLHAVRGRPRLLFNVHLDTVPAAPQWSADPLRLRVEDRRAIGLGACDVKGAAAAMLAVAEAGAGELAFLFSSDEEANDARCIAGFLREPHGYEAVVVAEPTGARAVLAHRGISSVRMRFAGRAGHASAAQGPADSALHQALRWGARALDWVDARAAEEFDGLRGLRFNVGRVEGGIKANVIAPDAELRFGLRPLPSMDTDHLLAELRGLAPIEPAQFEEGFRGPPLPARPASAAADLAAARALADRLGLEAAPAVDFWTEAALFSAAGLPTLVWGPGDIAQAHAADEWLALAELERYAQALFRISQP